MTTISEAEQALSFVDSEDRDTWVKMAMALKSEFGEEGYDVWDRWSRNSERYRAGAAKSTWQSVGYGSVRLPTLFHAAIKAGWRNTKGGYNPNPEEAALRKVAHEKRMATEEKERECRQKKAVAMATKLIADSELKEHAYLRSKQMPLEKGFVHISGDLVIPMRNVRNELVGAQIISAGDNAWVKMFVPGTRAKGACYRIGNRRASNLILVEGYATGLTVYNASKFMNLDVSVLVCFSAGNLVAVSDLLKCKAGVFADNDASKAGELAAQKTKFPYAMSKTEGHDANDDLREYGILHVAQIVGQLVRNMK